jgi:hypothetical protein
VPTQPTKDEEGPRQACCPRDDRRRSPPPRGRSPPPPRRDRHNSKSSTADPSPIQPRRQAIKKSTRGAKATTPTAVLPQQRRQRRNKSSTSESEYAEEDDQGKSRSRSAGNAKVRETKAAGIRPDPKAPKAPMCRIHRKNGIKFDSVTPTCTLMHVLSFTRVVSLEQYVEPKCNDCLIPISTNDACCVCFRCDPLHLLCVKCTFAASTDRVQIY